MHWTEHGPPIETRRQRQKDDPGNAPAALHASATGHFETAESPDLGDERQIRRLYASSDPRLEEAEPAMGILLRRGRRPRVVDRLIAVTLRVSDPAKS